MKKVETSHWKEFVVGDLFCIVKPSVFHAREVEKCADGVEYVVRSKFNNGVKYVVERPSAETNPIGTISFGAENASFFYRTKEWISGRDIYYIDSRHLTENTCLFIISCLQRIAAKYPYNFGLFPKLLAKETIKLPTTDQGQPDYDYMDKTVARMKEKAHKALFTRQEAIERAENNKKKIDISHWRDFSISQLFDIHPTKSYKLNNAVLFDGGSNPVIVNSSYNNGIGGYSSLGNTERGNIITFSDTTSEDSIFYQPREFIGYPHIQGMYPLPPYDKEWNMKSLLFFLVVFKKAVKSINVDYVNKFTREMAGNIVVKLPATPNGQPNFAYMENTIKALTEKVELHFALLNEVVK